MTIYKTTADCLHSWVQDPNSIITSGTTKFRSICRVCGAYSINDSDTKNYINIDEFKSIEDKFNQDK